MYEQSVDSLSISNDICKKLKFYGYFTVSDLAEESLSILFEKLSDVLSLRELQETICAVSKVITPNFYNDIDSYLKPVLLQESNPEDTTSYGKFEYNNSIFNDVPVSDMGLSVRSQNCLLREGYEYLHQLVDLDEGMLLQIRNMGVGSANETLKAIEQELKANRVSSILGNDQNQYDLPGEELIDSAYSLIAESSFDGITVEDISLRVLGKIDYDYCDKILSVLINNGKIKEKNGKYYEKRDSIIDILSSGQLDRNQQLAIDRLKGMTLEEIGKKYGMTRERARQISKKVISQVSRKSRLEGPILEERYKYIYETYEINVSTWIKLVDENPWSFYYLSTLYNKGKADISLMYEDSNIPNSIRQNIKVLSEAENESTITIEGKTIPLDKHAIEDFIVQYYFQDSGSVDDFFVKYRSVLLENGISEDSELFINSRQEQSHINRLSGSRFVLWKQNRRLRYYDIDGHDYTELLEILNLDQYDEIELSTVKLMDKHPELMEEYDIRDEYELHNLLKKIIDGKNKKISFERMPMIAISKSGRFSRENFVLGVISENPGVSKYRLSSIISEITGVKQDVIYANWLDPFEPLYVNGKYIDPKGKREKKQRTEAGKKTPVELSKGNFLSKEELDNILRILKKRYAGKTAASVVQIAGDNTDLPISKINPAAQKYYGVTRNELLKRIGVLQSGLSLADINIPAATPEVTKIPANNETNTDDDILVFMKAKMRNGTRVDAQGKYNKKSEECKVFAYSIISSGHFVKEDGTAAKISPDGVLMEDMVFKDPSSAAKLVCGMYVNGLRAWKVEDGRTLAEVLFEK